MPTRHVKRGESGYQTSVRNRTSARLAVQKDRLSPAEKEPIEKALALISEAARTSEHEIVAASLDCGHDIVWDWRSVKLRTKGYYAFLRVMREDKILSHMLPFVSYDWTPMNNHSGILSVRKECSFQKQVTEILDNVIVEGMLENTILSSIVPDMSLERRVAPVLMKTLEGMRSPCRSFRYEPEEVDDNHHPVQHFVLEVGMGEKTNVLETLARSYIQRGTLCVMTVAIERQGKYDFDWSYSLYRHNEKYEVICDVRDERVTGEDDIVTFPTGLTAFDFVPPDVLENKGVFGKIDERAIINLQIRLGLLQVTKGGLGIAWRETGKYMSQHLRDVVNLI